MNWLAVALPSILWLLALVAFLMLEALTVGLTAIWFAAGSLVGLILSLVTDNLWVQIFAALAVSLITLWVVRPLAQRHLDTHKVATNADRLLGMEAYVTQSIDGQDQGGQVTVAGAVWSARASHHGTIPEGTRVRIERMEGVKLYVSPLDTPSVAPTEKKEVL